MNQNLRTHVLKKGCLLCLSFCLWAGSALLAQNTSISLRVKDKPLKEVLNQIETDEGYIFLYKDKTMDLERKISLDVRNASLETILRRILDEKTEFGISERQVVLYTRKEAAKTSPADTPSRKITVRGTVRDAGGNVLIGVSVVEKGTTNGTATDANGLYSIDVKSAEAILICLIRQLSLPFRPVRSSMLHWKRMPRGSTMWLSSATARRPRRRLPEL